MRKYCKAYHLKDLHQFPAWSASQPEGSDLTDDSIVYLWDDFTVVTSPVLPDQGVLWQHVTPEWRAFCTDTLNFEIPEDLRYAYAQESQSASEQRTSSEEGA